MRPLNGAWVDANAKPSLGDAQLTTQPQTPVRVIEGTTVNLSVSAVATPAAYIYPAIFQWQKNGSAITGANSPAFSISNAKAADSGTYAVVVSAPSGKSVTSSSVVINVLPYDTQRRPYDLPQR